MSGQYVAPSFQGKSFNCSRCGAFSQQKWSRLYSANAVNSVAKHQTTYWLSTCVVCNESCIWDDDPVKVIKSMLDAPGKLVVGTLIWPKKNTAPKPSLDLPEMVLATYQEAAQVLPDSPRAAVALLRLAIQLLVECLLKKESTGDLNTDIGKLVKRGMRPQIQKALDIVRVTGNKAVHPAEIQFDGEDGQSVANTLFKLVNLIAEDQITQVREIEELFEGTLSEGQKQGVAKRDGNGSEA